MSSTRRGMMNVLIAAVLWGSSGVCAQYIMEQSQMSSQFLTMTRLIFAGLILLMLSFVHGDKVFSIIKNRKDAISLLIFSVVGALTVQLTFLLTIEKSNAATATVLQFLSPTIIVAWFSVVRKARPGILVLTAIFTSLIGTFLLVTHGNPTSLSISPAALFWGIASAFAAAFYTTYPSTLIARYGTLPVVGWSMLIGGMILLFPVSVFWAVLFGFWLPGLAAMQTLFPVLQQTYGIEVRSIPRPAAPEKSLTAQEQKKRSRANWWYYNWGIVAVAAMVIVGVAYVAHGLLTTVDPDYTVAVVTAEALPDEAVQRLQTALADYAEDANGDGAVIVQVNNYTWSDDAALTDMNGQMAGATQMNTDLANGESKIWILDDPEGFEQAYGALREKLGENWKTQLILWSQQSTLSNLDLGSYNTAADGSQTVDVQRRFAGYSVAVFDASDALWQALNS